MKKIHWIFKTSLLLILILTIYGFYPKNIYQISGGEFPTESEYIEAKINHKKHIFDAGESVIITDFNQIEKLSNFLSKYRFRIKPFTNYKDFDDQEFYYFNIKSNDQNILAAGIIDKKYLLIMNQLGLYKIYQIVGEEVDTDFIDSLVY